LKYLKSYLTIYIRIFFFICYLTHCFKRTSWSLVMVSLAGKRYLLITGYLGGCEILFLTIRLYLQGFYVRNLQLFLRCLAIWPSFYNNSSAPTNTHYMVALITRLASRLFFKHNICRNVTCIVFPAPFTQIYSCINII